MPPSPEKTWLKEVVELELELTLYLLTDLSRLSARELAAACREKAVNIAGGCSEMARIAAGPCFGAKV